ncbi:MAG: hypothetical protein IGS48_05485 [Oscillatoriales cyanobacterium C42_A2020_001]|nr:hypothetical protein [Leptolyngbyaceae cyanobacterium C42_A2020_001]
MLNQSQSTAPTVSTSDSSSSSTAPAPFNPASTQPKLPLRSPDQIDLPKFNALVGDWKGKPVEDLRKLFFKQVILDDQTTINVETLKVPGFIGISDPLKVTDASGHEASGHEDIRKFLDRDGLLVCTFQWNKERYGEPFDTRRAMNKDLFVEGFIKNEGHHSGIIVPAQRLENGKQIPAFATFNEPNDYHLGLYGKDGYIAAAQRLVFPSFVTPQQARGYTDTVICWMVLLNPFVEFPRDFNGGDPTRVCDRATLKEFLQNGLRAAMGDKKAQDYFKDPLHKCYCAEFVFVSLNTVLFPFNKATLTELLNGDAKAADAILAMQAKQNQRQPNLLSQNTANPQFRDGNIPMPVIPANLPPLDVLMKQNRQFVDASSLPFPPFKISQVIRRAFRTLLKRDGSGRDKAIAQAQARMFRFMEPALLQQLGLQFASPDDPKVQAVQAFIDLVCGELNKTFPNDATFDATMDLLMAKADEMLVGEGDRSRFVPPRIFVDLGQNDGDDNLPKGWGFRLETIGALVARGVIR